MTIRLEITGEKPEEFMFKAAKTLALILGRMGQQAQPAPPAEPQADVTIEQPATTDPAFPPSDNVGAAEPQPEPEKQTTRRPGRPKKPEAKTEVSEVPAEAVSEPSPAVTITEAQITERIREVIKAEEKREYERRSTSKGKDKKTDESVMNHGVRYTMALLAEFGAKKRSEIPAEQFEDFMQRSEAYLAGVTIDADGKAA